MLPRDRFLAALKRQPVDRVPLFDFLFQRPLFHDLIGRTPDAYNARDAMDLTVAMGLDGVWIPYGCHSGWSAEKITERIYKDEWGTTFQKDDAAWPIDAPIAFPLKTREDLRGYAPPDPLAEGRLDEINTAMAMNRELGERAVAVLGGVNGPLTVTWFLIGYENLCLSLYDDPGFLQELVDLAVDFDVKAINRMARAGVDAMILADDYGGTAQGLLRPSSSKRSTNQDSRRLSTASRPIICRCSCTAAGESTTISMIWWKSASRPTILCSVPPAWTSPRSKRSTVTGSVWWGTSIPPEPCPSGPRSKLRRRRWKRFESPLPDTATSLLLTIRSTMEFR